MIYSSSNNKINGDYENNFEEIKIKRISISFIWKYDFLCIEFGFVVIIDIEVFKL